jgi:hypothetical protein
MRAANCGLSQSETPDFYGRACRHHYHQGSN